jgi:hypothetical protein
MVRWLGGWLVCWLGDLLVGRLVCLVGHLVGLVGWLVIRLVCLLVWLVGLFMLVWLA